MGLMRQRPTKSEVLESLAFYNCTGLTSVTIPNSVNSIGKNAFSGCTGLTSINVSPSNPNFCSIDGVLFDNDAVTIVQDPVTLIQYPTGKQGAYSIPYGITSIGERAFSSARV